MMPLKELLAQYPVGAVVSVVCLERDPETYWVVGKVYKVMLDAAGNQTVSDGNNEYSNPSFVEFAVHELEKHTPIINPHIKDGKLPALITGFNPNKVVADDSEVRSYEEIESLIRVCIDIQNVLSKTAPDLERALVDLWFELKGTTK